MDKYYQILGLKPGASEKEILEAYKVLVKVWQPDRFSDDPNVQKIAIEKIKEIDEAFKQLLIGVGHHESGTPPTSQQEPLYEPSSKPLPRDDLKRSTEQVVVSPLGNKKKRGSFWQWLLWWRLDQNELDKQIAEYQSLKVTQSARGQSLLFLIFSASVTTISILFFNSDSVNFITVFISLLLGYFIYRGQKWAMIGAMILWTYEKCYQFYEFSVSGSSSRNVAIPVIWWAIYMHAFYLAFTVERLRKQNQAQIPKVFPKQNELDELAELKDKGIITEEEFKKKQKLDLERESHHESERETTEPQLKKIVNTKNVLIVLVCVICLAIGLFFGLPIIKQRQATIAKMTEVTIAMSNVASAVVAYHEDLSSWPLCGDAIVIQTSLGVSIPENIIRSITITSPTDDQVTITGTITGIDSAVDGKNLILTGKLTGQQVLWYWDGTVPSVYMPNVGYVEEGQRRAESYNPPSISKGLQSPTSNTEEIEKIRSLFENIRKANLEKNIDLFMSCFSSDFKGRDGKKLDTLKMWENFNYLDLSYDFKEQTISDDTANVRLEWLVRTSQKMVKQLREGRTVLDVTLKKEDGHWKIKEIRPVS